MAGSQEQHEREMAQLMCQIDDFVEVTTCFLCQTMEGRECVWDEVGIELSMEGRNTILFHETIEGYFMWYPTIAKSHRVARYACYLHYISTASTLTRGDGSKGIPSCVQNGIRCLFPDDGVSVWFNGAAAPGNDNDGEAVAAVHEDCAAVHSNIALDDDNWHCCKRRVLVFYYDFI